MSLNSSWVIASNTFFGGSVLFNMSEGAREATHAKEILTSLLDSNYTVEDLISLYSAFELQQARAAAFDYYTYAETGEDKRAWSITVQQITKAMNLLALEQVAQLKKAKIIKEKDGYYVKSEEGKNLGGPYSAKEEAEKRLRQVEYFKHQSKQNSVAFDYSFDDFYIFDTYDKLDTFLDENNLILDQDNLLVILDRDTQRAVGRVDPTVKGLFFKDKLIHKIANLLSKDEIVIDEIIDDVVNKQSSAYDLSIDYTLKDLERVIGLYYDKEGEMYKLFKPWLTIEVLDVVGEAIALGSL